MGIHKSRTKKKFGVRTYIPSTNHVLIIGDLRGQGRFESASWQPRDPDDPFNPNKGGDPFDGPVGAIEFIANEGGSIRPATNRFYQGSNAVFEINADEYKRLEKIKYNGAETLFNPNVTSTNYTIENIARTGTVEAVFGLKLYRVEFVTGGMGNPRYTIVTNVPHGTVLTQEVDVIHQVSESERRVYGGFLVE